MQRTVVTKSASLLLQLCLQSTIQFRHKPQTLRWNRCCNRHATVHNKLHFLMYAKVINLTTNGRNVYHNAGRSQRCASYLAKEAGGEATFFGSPGSDNKTAAEVVALRDGNAKGWVKTTQRFTRWSGAQASKNAHSSATTQRRWRCTRSM